MGRGTANTEALLGERATGRLRALLGAGPFRLVPIERDEDRYGRKLCIAVRGTRSIGDQLVREGLARTWDTRGDRRAERPTDYM